MTEDTVNLLSSLVLPLVLLILGAWLKKIADKHEKRAALHKQIIDKRLAIYEQVGANLNDIYVFLLQVGHWKALTPQTVLDKKRQIDKIMYVYQPYWSEQVFNAFEQFMNTGFETYTGIGEDAKLRVKTDYIQQLPTWQDDWNNRFSINISHTADFKHSYHQLMKAFADDFGHQTG